MSSSEKSDQGTGIGVAFRGFEFHFGSETEGIALKAAKLWQVIALPTSILEECMTCRSAVGLVLHPAGLEPATL